MTKKEQEYIRIMRESGCSYGQIADILNIKIGTVKSFCSRNNIHPPIKEDSFFETARRFNVCPVCGELFMADKHNYKQYCSDKCRIMDWRNKREEEAQLQAEFNFQKTLKKELDFLNEKSDEWMDDGVIRLCRRKE